MPQGVKTAATVGHSQGPERRVPGGRRWPARAENAASGLAALTRSPRPHRGTVTPRARWGLTHSTQWEPVSTTTQLSAAK